MLPCALLATVYLARRNPAAHTATGILSGIGVPLLIVAFLNREGPGMICHGTECAQQYSPWPWLIAGILFALLGIAAYVLLAHRRRAG